MIRLQSMNRRAEAVWNKTKWTCVYCGRHAAECEILTVDHVVPRLFGGRRAAWNLLPACGYCNVRRATNWPPSRYACPEWRMMVWAAEINAKNLCLRFVSDRGRLEEYLSGEALPEHPGDEHRLLRDFERLHGGGMT